MKNYQICIRCVMSSKIEDITFNSDGNCSYCEAFLKELKKISSRNPENLKSIKNKFISIPIEYYIFVIRGTPLLVQIYLIFRSTLSQVDLQYALCLLVLHLLPF